MDTAMDTAMDAAMDAARGWAERRPSRERLALLMNIRSEKALFSIRGLSILKLMNLSDVTSKWLLLVVSTKRLPRAFF